MLRSTATTQAGFQADSIRASLTMIDDPMLFLEGPAHRELRTATARFFTPKAVASYEDMIAAYAEELIEDLRAAGSADLSDLSMRLSVRVAAEVVGLTNSPTAGLARRLDAFFSLEPINPRTRLRPSSLKALAVAQLHTARFFIQDVLPAIRARRRQPQDDLISHLISREYSNLAILTECITFAAAGMVTTREFICAAAWHLLEDPELHATYTGGDQAARTRLLHEILRVEPVVGTLHRRTTAPLSITLEGYSVTIPAGDLVEVDIHASNDDPTCVAAPADVVWPDRARTSGVKPYGLSFGDGIHMCPGAFIAIEETDIFLTRLLSLEQLQLVQEPELGRNEVVQGYEIRDLRVMV